MAISTEILNTTFADLRGPLVNSFVRSNELLSALMDKARMPSEGGSLIERSFAGGAPARGVGVFVGDELLNMTRRQQTKRFQVEPHRIVAAINIPKKELLFNSGKLAVIRLIEEYPQTTLEGAKADLNAFLLTGVSRGLVFQTADLAGFLSVNGEFAAGSGTGVTNGLLKFATPATQNQSVQNVTKSTSYSHFNQYGAITAYATDGLPTLRKTYRQCAHYAGGMGKGPDLVVMDDDTYTNFEDSRLSLVRVTLVEDKTEKSNMLGLDLGVAKVYSSIDLDRTASTFAGTPAQFGVTYILNTDYLEMPLMEAPSITPFTERVGDQDVVTAIFSMQGNLICTKTPAQGCVSGGAI
jgi:hypothetical protein